MKIHLSRAGQSLGQFTPEELRAGYAEGKFVAADLAWRDGMASWQPLAGVIDELAPAGEDVAGAAVAAASVESGPPWEFRGERGVLSALLETIRLFLLEPTSTFTAMRRTGGLGAPLFYYVILGSVAGMAVLLYQAVWQSVGKSEPSGSEALLASWLSSPVIIGASIVLLPLYVIFEAFLSSVLTHGALLLVGGARRPFQATFRVVSYAGGSSYVLQLLPLIGVLAAMASNLVLKVIGLAVVHEISRTRAVVAVILPALIFLLFWVAIAVLATTAILSALGQAMQGG
jgi:hypothetical protein